MMQDSGMTTAAAGIFERRRRSRNNGITAAVDAAYRMVFRIKSKLQQ
jgi:hypothetical protein